MGLLDNWTQQKQTQQSNAGRDPYGPATPGLLTGLEAAQNLYSNDVGYNPYPGTMITPRSGYTKEGLRSIVNTARQGVPGLDDAFGFAQGMIANNGMTDDLNRTAGYLTSFADGSYVEDPRLAQAIKTREARAADTAASYASGAGRYGSGAMGSTMGQAVADAGNELMLQSNENARNRQLQASGMLGSLYESGLGRAAGAASMLPGLNELRYDGAERIAGVGALNEAYNQSKINAKMGKWDAQQARPWEQLQRFWSYPVSAANLGGTSWSIGQGQNTPSMLQNVATVAGTVGSMSGPKV